MGFPQANDGEDDDDGGGDGDDGDDGEDVDTSCPSGLPTSWLSTVTCGLTVSTCYFSELSVYVFEGAPHV